MAFLYRQKYLDCWISQYKTKDNIVVIAKSKKLIPETDLFAYRINFEISTLHPHAFVVNAFSIE